MVSQAKRELKCGSILDFLWKARARGEKPFLRASNSSYRLSSKLLERYQHVGDPELDEILHLLEKEGRPLRAGDDLLELAENASSSLSKTTTATEASPADRALAEFYHHYIDEVPCWVDEEQLERGQEVLLAYPLCIFFILYFSSLLGGFSIPSLGAVLLETAYLAPPSSGERTKLRLIDTMCFVSLCLQKRGRDNERNGKQFKYRSPLLPGGSAWRAAIHVRALHAKVRRALLTRTGTKTWDREKRAIPISQLDMAATLCGFSSLVLAGCEFCLGFPLPENEWHDYLALWRYLGWLLGCDTIENDSFPDMRGSCSRKTTSPPRPLDPCGPGWCRSDENRIDGSLIFFEEYFWKEFHPDETSIRIANHLLHKGLVPSTEGNFATYLHAGMARNRLGESISNALKLPHHPIWYCRPIVNVAVWAMEIFTFLYTLASYPGSPLRSGIIEYNRRRTEQALSIWVNKHQQRMNRELKCRAKKTTKGIQPSVPPTFGEEEVCTSTAVFDQGRGACPFAMVAPPPKE